MTAYKGHGTYGSGVGVETPLDFKLNNAAQLVKSTTPLVIRPGIFYAGNASLVAGTAGMAYSVAAYELATQRSASAGVVFGGNDGTLSVATTAAPGSNSRIEITYHWHREYSLDGVDSNPVIGVIQGTAAAVPTAPSLAAFPGAVEIGRATVSAGATATNGGGVVITQTAPFTSVDGGKVPFRTTTEMNVWTTALTDQRSIDLSSGITYRWNGTAWKAWDSDWITYVPTVSTVAIGTGGGAFNTWAYKYVLGDVRVRGGFLLGSSGSSVGGTGMTVTLPVTRAALMHPYEATFGVVTMWDVSATLPYIASLGADNVSVTVVRLFPVNSGPIGSAVGATNPFTWAAGDAVSADFSYKVA